MTLVAASIQALETSSVAPYVATVSPSWEPVLDLWTQMAETGAALAFQRRDWLEAWRETIGRRPNLRILAVTVREAERPVAGLPLVCEMGHLRRIGFADGGLADYNAPILSRSAPQDSAGALRLWQAVSAALPPADVIRLERMPERVGSRKNPFAMLPGVRPSSTDGLMLAMADRFDDWRDGLPRRYRMELGRCARLFDAVPKTAFRRVTQDKAAVFEALEKLQRERIAHLGLPYLLDEPDAQAFYRRISELGDASAVLTGLFEADQVVAALFGVRHDSTFTMLRIGASPAFARMSPARDLITRTMDLLNREGVTTFDFGLGDYTYKRKLGGKPHHLIDLVCARSPLGFAEAADFRLRAYVRRTPWLRARARRLWPLSSRDEAAKP